MIQQLIEKASEFIFGDHKRKYTRIFIYLVIYLITILPVAAMGTLGYKDASYFLTKLALSKRDSLIKLSTIIITERLDHLVDVGRSLATRVRFRQLISEGNWNEAIKIVQSVPNDFPYVERLFLADPNGTQTAAYPLLSETIGKSFAFREWYRGVSKNWEPYVSGVYVRTAAPQIKVIAIAIPIKDDNQKVIGILVMQVKPDAFFEWTKEINVGPRGVNYFVDNSGQILIHPKFIGREEVIDYSRVPPVDRILRGQAGIDTIIDPETMEKLLVAYKPDGKYGWGAVISQSTSAAFAERDSEVRFILIRYGIIIMLNSLLIYIILRSMSVIHAQYLREKTFMDNIGDGVIAIDRSFNITFWNRAAEKITGWKMDEAIGKPIRDVLKFIFENNRKENIVFIEEAVLMGETRFMGNHTLLIKKDGKEIPIGDSASPIIDQDGEILGAIVVFRDLSEERETQSMRSDFAYASHQLRTPLSKALWNLESSLDTTDLNSKRNDIKIAYNSLESIQRLTEELLEVSKIDQKTSFAKIMPVKISELMEKVIKPYGTSIKERNLKLEISAIPVASSIETDPLLFERAISEILRNAVIYNKKDGSILINVSVQNDGLVIEIRDSGIGIQEEQRPSVFTKFFRGYNFDTTNIPGAGLGLFICRSYISLLGGRVWLESEVNKGTSFYVWLPFGKSQA